MKLEDTLTVVVVVVSVSRGEGKESMRKIEMKRERKKGETVR